VPLAETASESHNGVHPTSSAQSHTGQAQLHGSVSASSGGDVNSKSGAGAHDGSANADGARDTAGKRKVDDETLAQLALSREEYDEACKKLRRDPTDVELGMIGALWSEHCAYKHSRGLFHHFYTAGEHVLTTLGSENAGAIDIGSGWVAVMKIESHNHPSAIEPYEGAATGVGGIVRDIFAMGAQPVALLDSLRFGPLDDARNRRLCSRVVAGIGGYGNRLGIPTVGGELVVAPEYAGNPLVNAMCIGVARHEEHKKQLISASAGRPGSKLMLVGADTGRDGLHGATFASVELDETSAERRPAVQVGNPFLEKLLMDACVGLVREHRNWIEGLQDCGAAGLTSSIVEMAKRAKAGVVVETARVPCRENGMTPYEIMLSESQERMVVSVKREHTDDVIAWFDQWDLAATEIGYVTTDGVVRVLDERGEEVAMAPVAVLTDEPSYERFAERDSAAAKRADFDPATLPDLDSADANAALLELLASPNIASKRWVWRQYDHQVGTNTVVAPGADAAVLRIRNMEHALAVCTDGPGRAVELDPYAGAARAVAEAARNVACVGARPIAVTDCLNFANPESPEIYFQLREAIRGIGEACSTLKTPVVSGNASLYNESDDGPVLPTPVIGMLGLLERPELAVRPAFLNEGDVILLLGAGLAQPAATLGASEYLAVRHGLSAGPVDVDLRAERALVDCLVGAAEAELLQSAHDCSEGGFAVALAESAIGGNIGAQISGDLGDRLDAALFGEAGARVVVSASPETVADLRALAGEHSVPCVEIGAVGGKHLTIASAAINLPLDQAAATWENALPNLLD